MINKNKDKIAVCLTCHNYGRFLEKSIQSLLNQTHKNWEAYLFLEECSDNSLKIAKKFKQEKELNCLLIKKKKDYNIVQIQL